MKLFLIIFLTVSLTGCNWKIVDIKKEREKINDESDQLHQMMRIQTLVYFEKEWSETVSEEQKVCLEEKKMAGVFLKDLKTINDALPEGEKILKPDGRLIDIRSASGRQKANLQDLTGNSTGIIETNLVEVKAATDRLSKQMTKVGNLYLESINTLNEIAKDKEKTERN